jgi:hypothetical protein
VVRVSEVGPDFRFTILPEPKPAGGKPPVPRAAAEQETEVLSPPAAGGDEQGLSPLAARFVSYWPAVAVGLLAFLAVLAGLIALRSSGSPSQTSPAVAPDSSPAAVPIEKPDG